MPNLFAEQNIPEISSCFDLSKRIILNCGDATDFCKSISNNSISLIITSPPYNLGKEYETKTDIEEYLYWQYSLIENFINILTDDGSVCWQVGNFVNHGEIFPLDIFYYNIFKKFGFQLRNRIIWHFGHGLHASKRLSGRYETILWFTKSDRYKFNLDDVRVPSKYPGKLNYKGDKKGKPSGNPLGKNPSDIWEFVAQDWENELWDIPNVKSNHPEKTIHPCQYPIELAERCVLALTDQDDFVYDPFSGVGSALLAGLKHNRKVIGCDKEEKYIAITKKRITDFYDGELKYRPIGKPIFVPSGREKVSQVPEEWKNLPGFVNKKMESL